MLAYATLCLVIVKVEVNITRFRCFLFADRYTCLATAADGCCMLIVLQPTRDDLLE